MDARDELARKVREGLASEEALRVFSTGNADPSLVRALADLGVRPETVPLMPLLPLIEIAWADGSIAPEERGLLETAAFEQGVVPGSPAFAELERLLSERPEAALFERGLEYVRAVLEALPGEASERARADIVSLSQQVAEAHGKLFGFLGSGVCAEEATALQRIAAQLSDGRPQASMEVLRRVEVAVRPPGDG